MYCHEVHQMYCQGGRKWQKPSKVILQKKGGVPVAASVMANLSDAVLPATCLQNECVVCNDKL